MVEMSGTAPESAMLIPNSVYYHSQKGEYNISKNIVNCQVTNLSSSLHQTCEDTVTISDFFKTCWGNDQIALCRYNIIA